MTAFTFTIGEGSITRIGEIGRPLLGARAVEIGTQARAGAFAEKLAELSRRCGLAQRLRDFDLPADVLPMLADDAMKQTRLLVNNLRPLIRADALSIYEQAW